MVRSCNGEIFTKHTTWDIEATSYQDTGLDLLSFEAIYLMRIKSRPIWNRCYSTQIDERVQPVDF
jgi:hypothetical protein